MEHFVLQLQLQTFSLPRVIGIFFWLKYTITIAFDSYAAPATQKYK